jgi:hypothetical protein
VSTQPTAWYADQIDSGAVGVVMPEGSDRRVDAEIRQRTLIGLSPKRREQSQIAPAIALTVLALLGFAAAVAYLA